jgi:hypothetical protein
LVESEKGFLDEDSIEKTLKRLEIEIRQAKESIRSKTDTLKKDQKILDPSDFLINDAQLSPTFFVDQTSDNIGFYSSKVSSLDFEVSIQSARIGLLGTSSLVLPTFGLMIRETLHPSSAFFALLVVQISVPSTYSICTFMRNIKGGNPELTGSWNVGRIEIGITDTLKKLKVTRSGHIFKGFWEDRQIGEAKVVMTEQSSKSKLGIGQRPITSSTRNTRNTVVRESLYVGIACYPIPTLLANKTKLPDPQSAKMQFKSDPIVSIQPSGPSISRQGSIERAFSIVEYYNLSLFHGDYGAGRTLNALSLLPGETTTITMQTYKDTSSTTTNTATVFDEITEESAQELEDEIEREQSNESQIENSMSAHVEANASWSGWGASVGISAGFETSNSSARQSMSRSLMRSLNRHATKASSKRTVEVKTTETIESEEGTSTSVSRTLRNINNSKTLTFIFRQMNQEYISALHLIDIKVAYIGGGEGTYAEESISRLDEFVAKYIRAEEESSIASDNSSLSDTAASELPGDDEVEMNTGTATSIDKSSEHESRSDLPDGDTKNRSRTKESLVEIVANDIREKARWILDSEGKFRDVLKDYTFTKAERNKGVTNAKEFNILAFNKEMKDEAGTRRNGEKIRVPGFVIATDKIVLRTDAVVTETRLGSGVALDKYGFDLQERDILERKAETDLINAKKNMLDVQKTVVEKSLQGATNTEVSDDNESPSQQQQLVHRPQKLSFAITYAFLLVPVMLYLSILYPDHSTFISIFNLSLNIMIVLYMYSYLRNGTEKMSDNDNASNAQSHAGSVYAISELLRSLNLLEPKYLAHKGYGPEGGKN